MSPGAVAGCWLAPVTFASSRHWGQRRIFLCQSYLIEIRSSVAICSQYCEDEERAWLILAPDKTILPLFYICHHVRSIYFWMYRDKAPPMFHSQFYKRSLRIFLRRQSVLAPHHEYIESRRNTKIDPSIYCSGQTQCPVQNLFLIQFTFILIQIEPSHPLQRSPFRTKFVIGWIGEQIKRYEVNTIKCLELITCDSVMDKFLNKNLIKSFQKY